MLTDEQKSQLNRALVAAFCEVNRIAPDSREVSIQFDDADGICWHFHDAGDNALWSAVDTAPLDTLLDVVYELDITLPTVLSKPAGV